jgi:hypothetical protein
VPLVERLNRRVEPGSSLAYLAELIASRVEGVWLLLNPPTGDLDEDEREWDELRRRLGLRARTNGVDGWRTS